MTRNKNERRKVFTWGHRLCGACPGFFPGACAPYPQAIERFQNYIKLSGDNPSIQISLGKADALAGQREKAQAILKRLETTKEYVSPEELATFYVVLGEREKAFASIEKAYAAHDPQLQYLGTDPDLDPLRSDPRFADLMRRVGLN
jgi:tetratricopeptide (TPR) repeat protein